MELEFTDDQLELRDNVREVLEGTCPRSLVRAVFEGDPDADDHVRGLWAQVVELYWPGVAIAEELGGLGLGYVELAIVAEELGRAVAPGPYLATVTQFAPLVREAGSGELRERLLGAVASGERTGTLALAEADRWEPDAVRTTATRTGDGWVLDGVKTSVFDGATADDIAVVARGDGPDGAGLGVFIVPGAAAKATVRRGLDPTIALADLDFAGVVVSDDAVLAAPGTGRVEAAVERALQEATVALAVATVGACRAIFEETLQYAKDREQYGRPIGSFQALKHRLADMYLSVERATSLCYYAALTIAEDDPRRAEAAALAKAAAGDCQRLLAEEGLQLHGGIGFTWEHDLHFLLKRAKTGDALLGTATTQRAALARMLGLATGTTAGVTTGIAAGVES
jgi:alkylation response protein AidB-like acyl-CoA dehydrogenase